MKLNKKTLNIKNKKLLLEESDTYGEALSDMTTGLVGDITKFATDSAKFWGNVANFLRKNSWLLIRYKVLGNISEEDFWNGIKNVRIDFVDSTDKNIDSIDSNVANMLSKAGISETEINSYLLGLPGYNIVENINASDILTGRTFNKSRYDKIDPLNFDVEELLMFFMLSSSDKELKNTSALTSEKIKKYLTENLTKVRELKIQIKKVLRDKQLTNIIDILNSIKNKKSKSLLDHISSLNTSSYRGSSIETKEQAEKFIKALKNKLLGIKDERSAKNDSTAESTFIKINGTNLNLITEAGEFSVEKFNSIYVQIVESLAVSLVFISTEIQDIVLKDFYEDLNNAIKKDIQKGIVNSIDKSDISISDNLSALHKNIAVCAFNMHYFSAELNFVDELIEKSVNNEIGPDNLKTMIQGVYKKEVGTDSKEFKPISSDLVKFVNERSNSSAFIEYGKNISDLKNKKKEENKNAKDVDLINEKYKVLYSIEICNFAESYFKFLKDEYSKESKNGSVENIKDYFKSILEDKINKNYMPKEIVSLLQRLNNVKGSDISSKMADVERSINDRKNSAKNALEEIKTKLESAKSDESESSSDETKTSRENIPSGQGRTTI